MILIGETPDPFGYASCFSIQIKIQRQIKTCIDTVFCVFLPIPGGIAIINCLCVFVGTYGGFELSLVFFRIRRICNYFTKVPEQQVVFVIRRSTVDLFFNILSK